MSIMGYFENLRYKRERQQRKGSALRIMSGLAIGSLLGGIAGVLFAPKAGKETRQEITEKVKETAAATKEKVVAAKDKVSETFYEIKEKVEEVKEKGKELKDEKLDDIDQKDDPIGGFKETYKETYKNQHREKNWQLPR